LGSCFVDYDKDLDYPFDIEDAFLIWMQQCFKVLKPGLEIDYEFEDLTKDLDGGWLLVLVISQYFSIEFDHQKLSCKTYVNNVEKSLNHQILNEVVEKCNNGLFVCWEAVDMVSERQRDGKYISPGNVSYLFVNLLFDLFQIVSIENIPFIKDVKKTKKLRDSKIKSGMIISKEETKNEMLLSIPNLLKLSEMNPQDERKLSAHLDPVSEKETDKPFNQEILSPKMSKMKQFKANNKHAASESKLKTKDKIKGPTTLPKKQGIIEDILKMSDTEVESSTLSKKNSQPVQSVAEDIIISNEFSTADSEILIENAIETIQKKDSKASSPVDEFMVKQKNPKIYDMTINAMVDGERVLITNSKMSKTPDNSKRDMIIPPKPRVQQDQTHEISSNYKPQYIQDLIKEEQELIYIAKNDQFANIRLNSKKRVLNVKPSPSPPSLPEIIPLKNESKVKSSDQNARESTNENIKLPKLINPKATKDTAVQPIRSSIGISLPALDSAIKPRNQTISRRKSDVYSVIDGLENELENLNEEIDLKSNLSRAENQMKCREISKITISDSAHAYFGNSGSDSDENPLKDVLKNIYSGSSSSEEESDLEVEQSTLNLIKRIKESREAKEKMTTPIKSDLPQYVHRDYSRNTTPLDLSAANPLLSFAHISLEQSTPQILIQTEATDTDFILDLYETPEPEKRQIVSRPQTGLLTYPLPDPSNIDPAEEGSWNRVQKHSASQAPKSAKKKQEQLNTRVQEAKQKKIDIIALKK
jgi:hypothetical protein